MYLFLVILIALHSIYFRIKSNAKVLCFKDFIGIIYHKTLSLLEIIAIAVADTQKPETL